MSNKKLLSAIDFPHLAFQIHETQKDESLEFTKNDVKILRELGKKYASIAAFDIQDKRKQQWKDLNDLRKTKPLIWLTEVCWHEMNVNNELTLGTENEVCQRIETELRRVIYQWKHMQGDMVVESVIYSPYIIENSGFGISPVADVRIQDEDNEIASRHFYNQFETENDLEKIKTPKIWHNVNRTEDFFQAYKCIFDGIVKVEKKGSPGFWFAPWDDIVFWMGAETVLLNLATKPDFMYKIIDRLVNAYLSALEQFEKQNLLSINTSNMRIGSGAYGYTRDIPKKGYDKRHVVPKDIWGSATPQIFGSVSKKMHKEFGLEYETKWLNKFGLTYYGCCEPLHDRIEILRDSIPNLRKISVSPWCNTRVIAEKACDRLAISLKPSPAVLAVQSFDIEIAKKDLVQKLEVLKDCNVEIVLKDISTVSYEPQRLWEWTKIATEITQKYA